MRFFKDGETFTLEPWRARAFPIVRDLIVNRSAFDRIIQPGGFITASTGSVPDANAVLVPKAAADTAFEAPASPPAPTRLPCSLPPRSSPI
jgi:succinate dehydrogenase / fumarate reductase iron-sulfur subunit